MSVSPTAIGDVAVVSSSAYNGVYSMIIGLPSGGGGTTWNILAGGTGSSGELVEIYWGVITSTGSSSLTFTMTGNPNYNFVAYRQFNGPGTWLADGSGAATDGSAARGNYASQTPTGANELYVATAWLGLGSGTIGGSTGGYVYKNGWGPFNVSTFVYFLNASNPTAYSPAWVQSPSDIFTTCAGLLSCSASIPNNIAMLL